MRCVGFHRKPSAMSARRLFLSTLYVRRSQPARSPLTRPLARTFMTLSIASMPLLKAKN